MKMAMLAEVRRIVGSVCRSGVVRSEVGGLFKTRPTHRSNSLNKDVACIAVTPYSIRESCTMLRKQTDTFQEVNDIPEIGLVQSRDRMLECRETSTLTNLKDFLEVLPASSEELSNLVDYICDAQQPITKPFSDSDGQNVDRENHFILALERCILDGIQLDRLFRIDSDNFTLKHTPESKSNSAGTNVSLFLPPSPRTVSLVDEVMSDQKQFMADQLRRSSITLGSRAIVSDHVLLCDNSGKSTSTIGNKDHDQRPSHSELDLIRQHLVNYVSNGISH